MNGTISQDLACGIEVDAQHPAGEAGSRQKLPLFQLALEELQMGYLD